MRCAEHSQSRRSRIGNSRKKRATSGNVFFFLYKLRTKLTSGGTHSVKNVKLCMNYSPMWNPDNDHQEDNCETNPITYRTAGLAAGKKAPRAASCGKLSLAAVLFSAPSGTLPNWREGSLSGKEMGQHAAQSEMQNTHFCFSQCQAVDSKVYICRCRHALLHNRWGKLFNFTPIKLLLVRGKCGLVWHDLKLDGTETI